MLDAKLPPPRPAVAATVAISQKGASGCWTSTENAIVGMRSKSALTMVQLRPPNLGTAKVYGNRMSAPTSPGMATSVKS